VISRLVFLSFIFILTSSCHHNNHQYNNQPGHYKIGNSYTINGITYYPKNYSSYEEIGTASWYGVEDHGTLTANGEIFNRHGITAAHKTLPLPCFVRVTNLRNGKKLIVRVNDRGPFYPGRIIDVSERVAKILEFHKEGLARVKVEYLKKQSEKLIKNNPVYRRQYENTILKHYPKKTIPENTGYITYFEDVAVAKSTASKLRRHGIKNVKIFFKNSRYYVKIS
jgi:rare lipoprotein A